MSALNIIIQEGCAAHLITDGAGAIDGKLYCHSNKTFTVPHLGLAGGVRGVTRMLAEISLLVASYSTPANFRATVASELLDLYEEKCRLEPEVYNFDLGFAGWADDAPYGLFISSLPHPGYTPFTLIEVVGALITPPTLSQFWLERLFNGAGGDIDLLAGNIIARQRSARDVLIGAFAQRTSVSSSGISQKVVRRFIDDKVER